MLEEAKSGQRTVITAVWETEERKKDLLFSEPYLSNEVKFLKRRGVTVTVHSIDARIKP